MVGGPGKRSGNHARVGYGKDFEKLTSPIAWIVEQGSTRSRHVVKAGLNNIWRVCAKI